MNDKTIGAFEKSLKRYHSSIVKNSKEVRIPALGDQVFFVKPATVADAELAKKMRFPTGDDAERDVDWNVTVEYTLRRLVDINGEPLGDFDDLDFIERIKSLLPWEFMQQLIELIGEFDVLQNADDETDIKNLNTTASA